MNSSDLKTLDFLFLLTILSTGFSFLCFLYINVLKLNDPDLIEKIYFQQIYNSMYDHLHKYPEHVHSVIPRYLKKHTTSFYENEICVKAGMLIKYCNSVHKNKIIRFVLEGNFNLKLYTDNWEIIRNQFTDNELMKFANSVEKFNFFNIKGVKVNSIDEDGENYLFYAVNNFQNKDLIDKALFYININYTNFQGENVIFRAKSHLSYLKDKGAKFDIKNKDDLYPLNLLIENINYTQYYLLKDQPIEKEKIDYSNIEDAKIYLELAPVNANYLYVAFNNYEISEDLDNIVEKYLHKDRINYKNKEGKTIYDIMSFEQKQKYLPIIFEFLNKK